MPEQPRQTTAVHYFYLLKEDEQDLYRLWTGLTSEAGGSAEHAPSLGLTPSASEPAGRCQIAHRVRGEEVDYCMVMLPDLAVVEVFYRIGPQQLVPAWREALDSVRADRRHAQKLGVTIFGETTVLVAESRSEVGEALATVLGIGALSGLDAASEAEQSTAPLGSSTVPARRILTSELDPALAGGTKPLLVNVIDHGDNSCDYFALATVEPDLILSSVLPEIDSRVKNLSRQAGHFGHQRRTITDERAAVDKQVGALLHQQVITRSGEPDAPDQLDTKIASLSRMFGLLATDSLLVRQAEDHLRNNLGLLESAFKSSFDQRPDAQDEIGPYYRTVFNTDLEEARAEAKKLNFSRQNAQAAIEVVRTQVELLRAREEAAIQSQTKELLSRSLIVQQERLALQVAAGFVEFVLVFYYVLKSWEGIAGQDTVEHIPAIVRLVVISGMSFGAAVGTHFLAQVLHSRSWKRPGLWISAAVLTLSLAAMLILTITS